MKFVELVSARWEWTTTVAWTWYKVTFVFIINRNCSDVSWLTKDAVLNLKFKESE